MSSAANAGSVPDIEYDNYDYASHHIASPDIHTNSTQSPLATFCREKQPEKRMLLGLGTRSIAESKREHKMNMMRRLAAIDIDKKLKQRSLENQG